MKIKVNDIVIPKMAVARVVDIKKDKVVFERYDSNGQHRTFEWTAKQAKTRGITLEELVNDNLYMVDLDDLKS